MQPGRMPPVFRPTFPSQRGIGGRTMPNTGAVPPPRLPVPMWNPTVPQGPGQLEGPNEGSGEGTVQTAQAPGVPPQGQVPGGLAAKLKDPRFAAWLMSVGSAMGQPRQVGQTGWGQAAQAMGQGYNTLAMYNEMQRQREMQDRDQVLKEQQAAAGMDKTRSDIALGKKGSEQTDKRIDIEEKAQESLDAYRTRTADMDEGRMGLEREKLDAQIAQANAQLAEMQRNNLDANSIKKQQLKIENLRAQDDLLTGAEKRRASKAGTQTDEYNAKTSRMNAGANQTRAASGAEVDKAQAKYYGAGGGRGSTGSLTQEERREARRFKAISEIAMDPTKSGLSPEERYALADEMVNYAERSEAKDNPYAGYPEGHVFTNAQTGEKAELRGGKLVPIGKGAGAAPPKSEAAPATTAPSKWGTVSGSALSNTESKRYAPPPDKPVDTRVRDIEAWKNPAKAKKQKAFPNE